MKRQTKGFTAVEILVVTAGLLIIVMISVGGYRDQMKRILAAKERKLAADCEELFTTMVLAKGVVALENDLPIYDCPVTVDQLRKTGLEVTVNTEGQMICPHGQVIDIHSAAVYPHFSCGHGENLAADRCQTLREDIQKLKTSVAARENLRWNDSIPVETLEKIDRLLPIATDGGVVCPGGGTISLNSVGQLPTCSQHTSQTTAEQLVAISEGGTEQ